MAKAVALTPDVLRTPQITPQAATPARTPAPMAKAVEEVKADQIPLQLRLPREAVRAIKKAAVDRDQTISEFMLACFHANIKNGQHAE